LLNANKLPLAIESTSAVNQQREKNLMVYKYFI